MADPAGKSITDARTKRERQIEVVKLKHPLSAAERRAADLARFRRR
jgi:hypothetical protein